MQGEIQVQRTAPHAALIPADVATLFRGGVLRAGDTVSVVNPASGKAIDVLAIACKSDEFATRVELTGTAMRRAGLDAPTRAKGSLAGALPCRLVGPGGYVDLTKGGVVRVWRYVTYDEGSCAAI